MIRFNINLPEELYLELRKEAFSKKVSISSLIVNTLMPTRHPKKMNVQEVLKSNPVSDVREGLERPAGDLDSESYV